MESGGSSNPERAGATTSDIVIQEGTSAAAAATTDIPATGNPNPTQVSNIDVADHHIPAAIITRIMRRAIPHHARISDDARVAIQVCVSEFIGFITDEAKERCRRESRRIVTANDVLAAMQSLGLDNYVETLSIFLSRYRAQHYEQGSTSQSPMVRPAGDFARVSPMAQMARPPTPPPSVAAPSAATDGEEHIRLTQFISEYILGNRGGGGGGEGSSSGGGA